MGASTYHMKFAGGCSREVRRNRWPSLHGIEARPFEILLRWKRETGWRVNEGANYEIQDRRGNA